MAEFAYRGRNASGELVAGVLEGPSSGAVADQLFSTGITPVYIDEARVEAAKSSGTKLTLRTRKVGHADLMLATSTSKPFDRPGWIFELRLC